MKLFERNTTLINKFIGSMIKMDQQMFEGTWRTKKSQLNLFDNEFNGKNEGKLRAFLFRSQREFELFDPLLQRKIDEMPVNITQNDAKSLSVQDPKILNTINGRIILFNGQYRDREIDINFQIDPFVDLLQIIELQIDELNANELKSLKIDNVLCTVIVKQNMYLQMEYITRLNFTF